MVLDTPTKKQTRAQVNRRVWRDFLDTYKSHVLYEEFKAGRSPADIAKERGIRDTQVLRDYFTERYGVEWDGRKTADADSDAVNQRISDMLADGHTHAQIASEFGYTRQAVSERVKVYGLGVCAE